MNRLWLLMLLSFLSVFVLLGLTGCGGSRVVFVPHDDGLVRLGPDVRGRVYVWNGSMWELSANKVDLPEGWYTGSVNVERPLNTTSAVR